MRQFGIAAVIASALLVAACGGGAGSSAAGKPTFMQVETVALSRLPSCPGKRAGPGGVAAASSYDRRLLKISEDATLACAGAVILHWYRFRDSAAARSFADTERTVLQNAPPFLVNGDVVVRVEPTRFVPPNARSLAPRLAADIKSACGCGQIVQP
jgi:hypothetical protein